MIFTGHMIKSCENRRASQNISSRIYRLSSYPKGLHNIAINFLPLHLRKANT